MAINTSQDPKYDKTLEERIDNLGPDSNRRYSKTAIDRYLQNNLGEALVSAITGREIRMPGSAGAYGYWDEDTGRWGKFNEDSSVVAGSVGRDTLQRLGFDYDALMKWKERMGASGRDPADVLRSNSRLRRDMAGLDSSLRSYDPNSFDFMTQDQLLGMRQSMRAPGSLYDQQSDRLSSINDVVRRRLADRIRNVNDIPDWAPKAGDPGMGVPLETFTPQQPMGERAVAAGGWSNLKPPTAPLGSPDPDDITDLTDALS